MEIARERISAGCRGPTLDGPARMRGAEVEGCISENILFGLYGNGTLKRKRNESGVADWGGGVAADAIFAEPMVHVGCQFRRRIHVKAQASYIVGGLGSTYRFGEDVPASPFPRGFVAGVAVGYRFRHFQ